MATSESFVKGFTGKVQHIYTVEDMDKRMESYLVGERLESPRFAHPASPSLRWYLTVYPNGLNEDHKGHVSAFLVPSGPSRRASYTFTTVNRQRQTSHLFKTQEEQWGWSKFQTQAEAKAQGSVWRLTAEVEVETTEAEALPVPKPRVLDLSRLLFDDHLADFALQVEGERIPVHRAALSVGSEVFAAMFRHPETEEGRTGVAVVHDASLPAIKAMLSFLYTARLPEDLEPETLSWLVGLGERYAVEGLSEAAEVTLLRQMDESNVLRVLGPALLHRSKALLAKAQRYAVAGLSEAAEVTLLRQMDESNVLRVLGPALLHRSKALLAKAQKLISDKPFVSLDLLDLHLPAHDLD